MIGLLWDYAEDHANSLQCKMLQLLLEGYKPSEIAKALDITSKRVTEEKSRFIRAAKGYFHYALAA